MKPLTLSIFLALSITGCAKSFTPHPHTTVKPPKPTIGVCKKLGYYRGMHAAVLIETNCMKPGLMTITVVLLSNNGKIAALETLSAIRRILGYMPKLSLFYKTSASGRIVAIFIAVPPPAKWVNPYDR